WNVFFLLCVISVLYFFCFNATATTVIYTLSLHDALPISLHTYFAIGVYFLLLIPKKTRLIGLGLVIHILADTVDCLMIKLIGYKDRKSTRLNSSHVKISYAVFCLKKKKKKNKKLI